MKYINEVIKILIVNIISIVILSILSYFDIINYNTHNIIITIILFATLFVSGLKLGKIKEKNGYLDGLTLGSIIVEIFLLLRIIFIRKFDLSIIIYYLLIIMISISGSILGINKKKNK